MCKNASSSSSSSSSRTFCLGFWKRTQKKRKTTGDDGLSPFRVGTSCIIMRRRTKKSRRGGGGGVATTLLLVLVSSSSFLVDTARAFSSAPVKKAVDVFEEKDHHHRHRRHAASESLRDSKKNEEGEEEKKGAAVVIRMGNEEDYEREHAGGGGKRDDGKTSSSSSSSSSPSPKPNPRRAFGRPKTVDELVENEENAVELTRSSLLKTPEEFKKELKSIKSEKQKRKEEAALAWFENTHPSSQYKMDEFERRQKEKEEFETKMRKERQKEEKKLTKRIEWFDDPVKDDDDDLWISDRQWQYDKNDPLMDFEDYEHDETEEEKKIDYGKLLLKRIKKKVNSMKTVEDLVTYQKDIMSSYGILDAEKAIEKQKDMENKQEAELAKKVIEENPAKATKSAAFAYDAELFEKALQRKTEKEEKAKMAAAMKTKNPNLDYNRKLFEKAMAHMKESA